MMFTRIHNPASSSRHKIRSRKIVKIRKIRFVKEAEKINKNSEPKKEKEDT